MSLPANLRVKPSDRLSVRIEPGPQAISGTVIAQPAKNYTTRVLLAAALAEGTSTVRNVAESDDAASLIRVLRAFGARIEPSTQSSDGTPSSSSLRILGISGKPRLENPDVAIDVGNAGAVLRLVLSVGALLPKVRFATQHAESLGKRPNVDLLAALESIGVQCSAAPPDGRLPITLQGGVDRLRGGPIEVSGARSSQYLSSLLFLAPLIGQPVDIRVMDTLVSAPAVRQTLEILAAFGIQVEFSPDLMRFSVSPGKYRARNTAVNGDWPGSAALLAASAVAGGTVTLRGLRDDNQGERATLGILGQMGATISQLRDAEVGVTVAAKARLRAVEFDGDTLTDAVLPLVAAAAFAEGRTRVFNVANLRIKECDRIREPIAELRKLGVRCWEGHELGDPDPDAILIEGNPNGYEGGIVVDGRRDHRVIMLLAIVGLRCRRGLTITEAEHIAKSYPDFFTHLAALGANVTLIEEGLAPSVSSTASALPTSTA